ncbi:hypothetical protein [Cribrihabitans pelagius]|uniref:hypothetical protein n=1 Tax=Cribrihabitans pelagius TaxID=1765746 RepID=UPI003B5C5208
MIICHPLKLIFIKTKKVGGTSFEMALSSFCDAESVITPITPNDEAKRVELGYRGAQNYKAQTWPDGSRSKAEFYNHMPAALIRAQVPKGIWDSYRKVTIWRDPYDAAISRYYWEELERAGISFGDFTNVYRHMLQENRRIAPLEGANAPDVFLRYEHLEEDIAALGIAGLWERFSALSAKGGLRPKAGAEPQAVYQAFPQAADIIEEQCQGEIARFGYPRPVAKAASAPVQDSGASQFIFTLSAGRTGTAWLAELIKVNLQMPSVHEPLGIGDFGKTMPEIRHMRTFNTVGMDGLLCDFWERKLAGLQAPYAESNHTLGKCGLIEALAESSLCAASTVVILRRDLAKQSASYVVRGDFKNITIPWQWYLDRNYPNVIVSPDQMKPLGEVGYALWYAMEMAARQAYYQLLYGNRVHFVEAQLEDATKPEGAARLLAALGYDGPVTLPPKKNAMTADAEMMAALTAEYRTLLARLNFDPLALAARYIEAGRRLDTPPVPRLPAAPAPAPAQAVPA